MKNEFWKKAESIFHRALNLPVGERNLFLKSACAGDVDLISEVESLLYNFENNSNFLDEPVFELGLETLKPKTERNLSGSLIGFYQLQEKIGSGGMGEVYKALDARLNRPVALKLIPETLKNDHLAKRRLVKEAQAVAMLDHPNICAVHGIEQVNDHHFIVMQFIEGKTIAEIINHEKVTVDEFKSLARQIITAVAFAHSHGIIHRDLKPGNIMLSSDGQIKVLDFGLAKIISQKQFFEQSPTEDSSRFSQSGMIIGTVSYMSPEQLRGEKLDYRSDIFSVGVVLYELAAGRNPFNRKTQAETIAAILSDEPPALEEIAPDFPLTLTSLVEKCLHKNKDFRFQSAAEMLVELDKAQSVNSRRLKSESRRQYFVKILLAFIVVAAVCAGLLFYVARPSQKTFAVMPISYQNAPTDKDYVADDLTQSIIEKLSKLDNLKVKNEYFTSSYKGKNVAPQIAGTEMNADAVFSGTIEDRLEGRVLRTKIVKTSDGSLIDSYDWKVDEANLVGLPEEIAERISSKIQLRLTDKDKNNLVKKETESNEAKKFYLQGRLYLKQRKDSAALEKAVEAFTTAKDLDQNYAKAWAGLSDAYLLQSAPGVKGAIDPQKAVGLAKTAANKALDLDNTLCDTYNSLGLISFRYDWNWKEAEGYFRKAIELDAEFIPARLSLIKVLKTQERYDEALEEAKKAKKIDPLSVAVDIQIALIYYRERDYNRMDETLSELLQRLPNDENVKYVRAYQFLKTGRFKDAVELLEPIYNLNNEENKILVAAPLGFAYAKMGRRVQALKIISDLEKFGKAGYVPPQEKALIYVGLGDYDKAFENLNLSCAEKFPSLPGWINEPLVDEIKTDPRFAEIKRCAGL